MLSNGESFLQFGQKAKIINGVSFMFLTDYLACPEIKQTTNIQQFSGEFAAVLMNRTGRQTNLSRDVFGAKSLFYYYKNHLLIAATDLRNIIKVLEAKPELDAHKISEYLNLESDNELISENTFFKDIKRVLPGQTCIVFPDGVKKQFFWKPKDYPLDAYSNPLNFFSNAFDSSIRARIQNDQHIGANLSGGLDSSSIVSSFRKLSKKELDTYYFDTKLESAKEKILANKVSEEKVTNHFNLDSSTSLLDDSLKLIKLTASPDPMSVPSSIFLPIYQKAEENGNKIMLSGHGGDNLLENGLDYLNELKETNKLENALYSYYQNQGLTSGETEIAITKFIIKRNKNSVSNLVSSLFRGEINIHVLTEILYLKVTQKGKGKVAKSLALNLKSSHRELKDFYQNINHEKTERLLANNLSTLSIQAMETIQCISRAYGVSTTYPFLTKELLETVSKIPSEINFAEGKTRGILKESMKGIVPKAVLDRKDKSNFTDYFVLFLQEFIPDAKKVMSKSDKVWTYADQSVYEEAEKIIFDNSINPNQKLREARVCYRTLSLSLWLSTFS